MTRKIDNEVIKRYLSNEKQIRERSNKQIKMLRNKIAEMGTELEPDFILQSVAMPSIWNYQEQGKSSSTYHEDEMQKILEKYHKLQEEYYGQYKKELNYLNECLELLNAIMDSFNELEEPLKTIIEKVYINHMTKEQVAYETNFGRTTIYRKINAGINIIRKNTEKNLCKNY